MDFDYKVRYNNIDTGFQCSEWMSESQARKFFSRLKDEKVKVTIWAELIYSPIDEDNQLDEVIVDDFERRVIELMGHKFVV